MCPKHRKCPSVLSTDFIEFGNSKSRVITPLSKGVWPDLERDRRPKPTLKHVETRWKDGGWETMIAKIPPWTWLGTRFAICEVWLNDTRIVSTSAAMNIRGITWNKFRNKQMNSKWIANKLPRPHFLNASSRTELPAHAAKITNIITRMMDIAMAQH